MTFVSRRGKLDSSRNMNRGSFSNTFTKKS
jgi:hypothetical protein